MYASQSGFGALHVADGVHVTLPPGTAVSQHLDLLQHCCTFADFMTLWNACGGFLRECLACKKQILSV